MTTTCEYPDCTVATGRPSGKGRPRKYCPEHARTVKRERDRNRIRGTRLQQFATLLMRDCCADAKRANPRVRTCPQHRQWNTFLRQSRAALAARTASKTHDPVFANLAQNMPG